MNAEAASTCAPAASGSGALCAGASAKSPDAQRWDSSWLRVTVLVES